jgi:hypothetical protein
MATVQLNVTTNGSFKICGKDLFGKSDGSKVYSSAEIFAIIKLWKNGDLVKLMQMKKRVHLVKWIRQQSKILFAVPNPMMKMMMKLWLKSQLSPAEQRKLMAHSVVEIQMVPMAYAPNIEQ